MLLCMHYTVNMSRLARLQVQASGCVRSLTIRKCEPCDSGNPQIFILSKIRREKIYNIRTSIEF